MLHVTQSLANKEAQTKPPNQPNLPGTHTAARKLPVCMPYLDFHFINEFFKW